MVDSLSFRFLDDGILTGSFSCSNKHEGFDAMMNVGIIASVIDASMGQCLMGHGIVAYTADLSIRFRFPALLGIEARIRTLINAVDLEQVYHLKTHITQKNKVCVRAKAKFFRIN
jgi:acyl-CoA thioesterase FadM